MKSREEQDTTRERTRSGTPSGKNNSTFWTVPSHHSPTHIPPPTPRIEKYTDPYHLWETIPRATSPPLLPPSPHLNLLLNLPQPQFVPLRNLFGTDSELRDEKTFAELIGTPTLLSPLDETLTVEEDISCAHATINLLETLAALRSLFPTLSELSTSTSPTPSSLLAAEDYPVSPYQDSTNPDTPIRVIDDSFVRQLWSTPEVEEGPPTKKIRVRVRGARKTKKNQLTKRR